MYVALTEERETGGAVRIYKGRDNTARTGVLRHPDGANTRNHCFETCFLCQQGNSRFATEPTTGGRKRSPRCTCAPLLVAGTVWDERGAFFWRTLYHIPPSPLPRTETNEDGDWRRTVHNTNSPNARSKPGFALFKILII